jgi:hypothetical protein
VGDHAFSLGEQADVIADLIGSGDCLYGGPCEVNGLGASLIWFPASAHDYQFSLITRADRSP